MAVRESLVSAARAADAARLVRASSGNVSGRLDADRFFVSASGCWLGELTVDDFATVSVSDPGYAEGRPPSLETPFHRAIYRAREDVGAIVHFQSEAATAIACSETPDFSLDFVIEVPAYRLEPGVVPYLPPGSEALAEAVGDVARYPERAIIVLLNHGQIALGRDARTALRNAMTFEFACAVKRSGLPMRRFRPDEIEALRRYRP